MIKNQRQYNVTRAQLKKFSKATKNMKSKNHSGKHPLLAKAEIDALHSMREDLQSQIDEYDRLRDSKISDLNLESALDLPLMLIKARISSDMSQKDLAESIGVKEQQIQRYESTEYASASMSRIKEIIRALNVDVKGTTKADADADAGFANFFKKLNRAGIGRDFVVKKILPPSLAVLTDDFEHAPVLAKRQIVEAVGKVFGFGSEQLSEAGPLRIDTSGIRNVKFKKPGNANEEKIWAYTVYVNRIATLIEQVTRNLPRRDLPDDPIRIYDSLTRSGAAMTLEALVDYVWGMGMPVLALADGGMFHGAYLNKNDRHVIILNQNTKSAARLMFDLLHEFWHAVEDSRPVIHMIPHERGDEEANRFAKEVLLGGDSQRLTDMCLEEARYRIPYLKRTIPRIARRENVSTAVLANCMAYEMSRNGDNIWGMAANMDKTATNPRITILDAFVNNTDLSSLDDSELLLLQQALNYGGTASA